MIITTGAVQHSPTRAAQALVASREIIKEESSTPQYLPPAAHTIYVQHSFLCQQWDVFGNNPGSNHRNQSHTTFADSRIIWGACQLTIPAVHRLWLLTLMFQQPSLSLGRLQPDSLQAAIPRQLIWLPITTLILGNRREPGCGTSVYFPTRHQLS